MAFVLIVDDDEDVAKTIEMTMNQDGHQTAIAGDGYAALQRAHRQTPDLVILDIGMPGMDGIEVCRRLRGNPATAACPILFLTARCSI